MKHMVFLVEDDPSTRELYDYWLKDSGFDWKSFASAEPCLSTVTGFELSVICLDVGLPGISGMEALQHLKRMRPTVPVIVMTADEDARSGVEAIKNGAVDYLVKPLEFDEFTGVIENAIQRYELGYGAN